MLTFIFWTLGTVNALIWLFNWIVSMSDDRSGSGMVLMFTVPLGILVGLVSLIVVGFLT